MVLLDSRPDGPPRPPADTKTVDCPDCGGAGELRTNPRRDPATGLWDSDVEPCLACSSYGAVSTERAVTCDRCGTRTTWRGTRCPLHDDLCPDCLPAGRCTDCTDTDDWNADNYYGSRP